jgi:hypothetical protein
MRTLSSVLGAWVLVGAALPAQAEEPGDSAVKVIAAVR